MRKTVTRCPIIMVALFSIILVSFPLFPSTAGIVSNPQLVDRTLKGDRLTNVPAAGKIGSKAQPSFVKALKVPIVVIECLARCRHRNLQRSLGIAWCSYRPRRSKFVCRSLAVRCLHESTLPKSSQARATRHCRADWYRTGTEMRAWADQITPPQSARRLPTEFANEWDWRSLTAPATGSATITASRSHTRST